MDSLAKAAQTEAEKSEGPQLAKTVAGRRAAGILLELLASAFRDALYVVTGSRTPLVNNDQQSVIESLARRFDASTLADVIEQLSAYEDLLRRNVNPKLIWDNLAVTCACGARLGL
jgi:hypothetical protein